MTLERNNMTWQIPNAIKLGDSQACELFEKENPNFKKVFDFLNSHSLEQLKKFSEKIELDGDNAFLIFSKNNLKKIENARLEAHDKYIDLQLVLEGSERIGVRDRNECLDIVEDRRDAGGDIVFFAQKYDKFVELNTGEYAVLPTDCAHAPTIGEGEDLKCIAKIKVC